MAGEVITILFLASGVVYGGFLLLSLIAAIIRDRRDPIDDD